MVRLDRDQRRELVGQMAAAGMSTRDIASGLGASDRTVLNDRRAGANKFAPDTTSGAPHGAPDVVLGLDGKQYPARVTSLAALHVVVDQPPAWRR